MPFMAANHSTTGPITLSPRDAAELFFKRYPLKRRCTVAEGYLSNGLFVSPMRGRKWLDITRSTMSILPTSVTEHGEASHG